MLNAITHASIKPHPEAFVFHRISGERQEYPGGRTNDARQDLNTLKILGWEEVVFVVESATGNRLPISVEPTCGAVGAVEKALKVMRPSGGPGSKLVRSHYLVSEWESMSEAQRHEARTGKPLETKGGKS